MDKSQRLDESQIKEYFATKNEVIAVYLFGSRAEGVARPDSDLDIAVLIKEQAEDHFAYRMGLAEDLEKLAGIHTEVVVLQEVPLLLQFQVLKHGKLLFERDPSQRAAYQMRLMSRYYDYKRFFDFHSRSLRKSIKEGGLGRGSRRDHVPPAQA